MTINNYHNYKVLYLPNNKKIQQLQAFLYTKK